MRWFQRRRRFSLGRYVGPEHIRQATVDEMVDDGVLIAGAAVRLAVKNLVILKSLRDRVDYSVERTVAAVREELENLAEEKDADAVRLVEESELASSRQGKPRHYADYRPADMSSLARRSEVSRRLAARLRELSADEGFVSDLVEGAHAEAWAEIAASITARAALASEAPPDEAYDRERGGRLLLLLGDLADLDSEPRQGTGSAVS